MWRAELQDQHSLPIEALTKQLRDLDLIAKLAADPDPAYPSFPTTPADLAGYRTRGLQLPDFNIKPIVSDASYAATNRAATAAALQNTTDQINSLLKSIGSYRAAIDELAAFKGEHFISTPQTESPAYDPPDALKPVSVLTNRATFLSSLASFK